MNTNSTNRGKKRPASDTSPTLQTNPNTIVQQANFDDEDILVVDPKQEVDILYIEDQL